MDLSNKALSLTKKHVHQHGYKYPVEKRIEVITQYLAIGNMRIVSEKTGVGYDLCRAWKQQSWWKELEAEIRATRTIEVNNKLSKLVDRSLDLIEDRLVNGDFVFNQKTGEVVRKEVSLRDANTVAKDMLAQQQAMLKEEKEEISQQSSATIQEQLKLLASEFAKFNGRNKTLATDVAYREVPGETDAVHEEWKEGLQNGSGEVYLEARSEEETS